MTMFRRLATPATFLIVLASLGAWRPEASERVGIAPLRDQERNALWISGYLGMAPGRALLPGYSLR